MIDRIKSEPVLVMGAIMAGIALGTAFGLQLSGQQIAAIETFAAAVLSLIVRSRVTPAVGPPRASGETAGGALANLPAKGDGE